MIVLKSASDIGKMAAAGEIVASTLGLLESAIRPGVATGDLDRLAEEFIRDHGGAPTFKGYRGFPASICASPNAMVVHGIPGSYEADDGDILSIDVGVTLDGFVADSAWTFPVGEIADDTQRLLSVCRDALGAGIAAAQPGGHVGDVSAAVQTVTEAAGFSIVRTLVGHGVGRSMHEEPQVPNFGEVGRGAELRVGTTIAIEPMITAGGAEVVVAEDGWSILTSDSSLSAHFEHTVAITTDGPRVLTQSEARPAEPVASPMVR